MSMLQDMARLKRLRLCRADVVSAMSASERSPNSATLRELSELQLVIMATEQAIRDKQDAEFLRSFEELNAA